MCEVRCPVAALRKLDPALIGPKLEQRVAVAAIGSRSLKSHDLKIYMCFILVSSNITNDTSICSR